MSGTQISIRRRPGRPGKGAVARSIAVTRQDILKGALAKGTLIAYTGAFKKFASYLLSEFSISSSAFVMLSSFEVDQLLSEFFVHEFNAGTSFSMINNCFNGLLHFYPQFKRQWCLLDSHAILVAWWKQQPVPELFPLPWRALLIIARIAIEQGFHHEAAALLLLGETWMRSSSLLRLKKSDFSYNLQDVYGLSVHPMSIRLRKTKTGFNKCVFVRRPAVASIIWQGVQALQSDEDLLFNFSYPHLNSVFRYCAHLAGFSQFHWTLHRIRAGGASEARLLGWPMAEIIAQGTWASSSGAEHYINVNLAMMVISRFTTAQRDLGHYLDSNLALLFASSIFH